MNRTTIAASVGTTILAGAAIAAFAIATAEPETRTVKVVEVSTPAACVDALDVAEQIVAIGGEVIGASPDALEGAYLWDADAIDAFTVLLEDANDRLEPLVTEYQSLRAECEGAAA